MKRISFVATLAILLAAGCQKTEIINPVGGKTITFTTGMSKLTKASGQIADANADPADLDFNLKAQDFRLWAFNDYEDPNTGTPELDQPYDHIANMEVDYYPAIEGRAAYWAPVKEYYWPGVDKSLRFFAVSGFTQGGDLSDDWKGKVNITINRTPAEDDEDPATKPVDPKLEIKDFVVDHLSPNTDLMVADFICQNQSVPQVDLTFRHALSKVQFLFKTIIEKEDEKDENGDVKTDADGNPIKKVVSDPVFVQSLEVTGVNTTSTLTVTENTGDDKETNPMSFAWGEKTAPEKFTDDCKEQAPIDFPTEVELIDLTIYKKSPTAEETAAGVVSEIDDTVIKLTDAPEEFATWLVIPQSIVNLQVKVTYIIGKRQLETVFPLCTKDNDGNVIYGEWGRNQYTRYTITLAPNKISFEPKVDDWAIPNNTVDYTPHTTTSSN